MSDTRGDTSDSGGEPPVPDSLIPYNRWTEDAFRTVMVRALRHAATEGMPGDHHFYVTFRTDHPGVVMPARLRAQYRQEMTIVLQHQFWDLVVDEVAGILSVGLSFGGMPTTLRIPLGAVTAFADPHVRFGLQFQTDMPDADEPPPQPEPKSEPGPIPDSSPQVVSLDAFRRRTPAKDSPKESPVKE